jgi:hypothetical protein
MGKRAREIIDAAVRGPNGVARARNKGVTRDDLVGAFESADRMLLTAAL